MKAIFPELCYARTSAKIRFRLPDNCNYPEFVALIFFVGLPAII